jgi:hypothetical protein
LTANRLAKGSQPGCTSVPAGHGLLDRDAVGLQDLAKPRPGEIASLVNRGGRLAAIRMAQLLVRAASAHFLESKRGKPR